MSVANQERPPRALSPKKAAAKSGIPVTPDPNVPLPKRLLTSKFFWLSLILIIGYAVLLKLLYDIVVPDREVPGGQLIGLGTEAVPIATKYAAITVIPLSLIFLWLDRFRPQRFWIWFLALGWGAAVATFFSANVNSWAAQYLSIEGDGDPATGARAAIYVAPFVEEASKGTILFALAIFLRYQWVSRISGIVLAGLSGAGFAFVENIIYYGRAYRYAAQTFGEIPPLEALQGLFVQRGLMTCFGHPLFTSMLGVGLAIGLRSKSKVVRIVAPLAGYCAAALLHMGFNTMATFGNTFSLLIMYVPLVIIGAIFVGRQMFREGALIRQRLTDYVRVGWLPESDAAAFSRLRTRARAVWHSLFLGWYAFAATIQIQRAVTELAYLRDAMARGLVDSAGLDREKELLARIRDQRMSAVVKPEGRANYPSFARRRKADAQDWTPPTYPGPGGISGNYPAPGASGAGSAPLGQTATQYSEVNPTWGPPSS